MTASDVDALLAQDALVYGSLPPAGRDLDLLLDGAELARVGPVLEQQGWVRRRSTWARFAGGTAFATDLRDLDAWAPTPEAARLLRAAALPIEGYAHLRAPAPHHQLLVLARRVAEGTRLDERKRARLATLTEADWDAAQTEAPQWGLAEAVPQLRVALDAPPAAAPARRGRGHVVALAGLDGAGKSTQGEHLRAALEALGYEVSLEWTKIGRDPALARVGKLGKALLRRVAGARTPPAPVPLEDESGERRNFPDGPPPPKDAGKQLRERSALLTWLWTLLVAWTNGRTHRRVAAVPAGRVVICDRYTLDSLAHLRYRYGPDRRFRVQGLLLRALSPRPRCAVFLDVSPATARARKPEQYTTADLVRLQRLYREEAARHDVLTVDPEQPLEQVAAQIAAETWLRLDGRRRR